MEAIRDLAPLGISAVAILFVFLVYQQAPKYRLFFGVLAIVSIISLVLIEKLFPTPQFEDAGALPVNDKDNLESSGESPRVSWVNTTLLADWGGEDRAATRHSIPTYGVEGLELCNQELIGNVAVCWDTRPTGYPQGVPKDFQDSEAPHAWCTYKKPNIRLSTYPDGGNPGRVYVCERPVSP